MREGIMQPAMFALGLALLTRTSSAAAASGLTLSVYNNTALHGAPASSRPLSSLDFSLPLGGAGASLSAEVTGTLVGEPGQAFNFSCDFGAAVLATLHVDDHLVCQLGANAGKQGSCGGLANAAPTPCSGTDNPLPVMTRKLLPVRLAVMYNPAEAARRHVGASQLAASLDVHVATNAASFTPELPPLEQRRREMQRSLLQGWGLFYDMSYTDQVLLPHGARVKFALCESAAGGGGSLSCLTETRVDWAPKEGLQATLRPGLHAYDRSYAQMFVSAAGCNVSFTSGGGAELNVLVEATPDQPAAGGGSHAGACEGLALVAVGLSTWFRSNDVTGDSRALRFASAGLGDSSVHASSASETVAINATALPAGAPRLVYQLAAGRAVGFSSGAQAKTLGAIRSTLAAARAAELKGYEKYGGLAETKAAVQAAVMWQVIFNPLEQGPLAPVIRGNPWGLDRGVVNDDWPYVIFDWDNHFGAYMLSLDAKELGYSALMQVIKAKTNQGFVSNVANAVNKEQHSQPPVGSKVLLEMYTRHNDSWVVELLFDDLLDWNDWFHAERRLPPLNLTCLGSGEDAPTAVRMQNARYESGLDNSPMYDDWKGDFADGKMQLYDVGFAGMHAMDCRALAQLGRVIGRDADAAVLEARGTTMAALIEEHLWDEQSGIYVNRKPGGDFSRRISPTSFYALQTGAATVARVDTLVSGWLQNKSRFAVTSNGDPSSNDELCYWGLPSIQCSDAAFKGLGYWRGYVWGPMAQLTYWGLNEFQHVPSAKAATTALCTQMRGMMLEQWRAHGHICENYYPAKGHGDCSPGAMKFYHWGALSGFISLLHEGYY